MTFVVQHNLATAHSQCVFECPSDHFWEATSMATKLQAADSETDHLYITHDVLPDGCLPERDDQ